MLNGIDADNGELKVKMIAYIHLRHSLRCGSRTPLAMRGCVSPNVEGASGADVREPHGDYGLRFHSRSIQGHMGDAFGHLEPMVDGYGNDLGIDLWPWCSSSPLNVGPKRGENGYASCTSG